MIPGSSIGSPGLIEPWAFYTGSPGLIDPWAFYTGSLGLIDPWAFYTGSTGLIDPWAFFTSSPGLIDPGPSLPAHRASLILGLRGFPEAQYLLLITEPPPRTHHSLGHDDPWASWIPGSFALVPGIIKHWASYKPARSCWSQVLLISPRSCLSLVHLHG